MGAGGDAGQEGTQQRGRVQALVVAQHGQKPQSHSGPGSLEKPSVREQPRGGVLGTEHLHVGLPQWAHWGSQGQAKTSEAPEPLKTEITGPRGEQGKSYWADSICILFLGTKKDQEVKG